MKPKGRSRKAQPSTASLFEWALTLEQGREAEPIGAGPLDLHTQGEDTKIGVLLPFKYMRPFLRFTPLHRIAGITMLVWPLTFTDAGVRGCVSMMLRRQGDIAYVCDRCHRGTVHFGQVP